MWSADLTRVVAVVFQRQSSKQTTHTHSDSLTTNYSQTTFTTLSSENETIFLAFLVCMFRQTGPHRSYSRTGNVSLGYWSRVKWVSTYRWITQVCDPLTNKSTKTISLTLYWCDKFVKLIALIKSVNYLLIRPMLSQIILFVA